MRTVIDSSVLLMLRCGQHVHRYFVLPINRCNRPHSQWAARVRGRHVPSASKRLIRLVDPLTSTKYTSAGSPQEVEPRGPGPAHWTPRSQGRKR
ncbi:hypothetical protein RB195_025946 [Necator americanus]|uniref:Secreted protein n=1 Tax=Necator americanus TaxID=51031 RepID=A0ABR1EUU9_NECAM